MLKTLHIENYALIQQSDIDFSSGFTAITGETGAGKSILLGALGLLLGQRADLQSLGQKDRKCVVESSFDIASLDLKGFFEENDLDYEEELVVRREILPSGKSRGFINDTPVTLPQLRDLGGRIINIHSQHETLTLGSSQFQISLLDILGEGAENLRNYKEEYLHYSSLKSSLEELTRQDSEKQKDLDYSQFLFDELQEANLQPDEQDSLEKEQGLLSNTEAIKTAFAEILNICDYQDDSALSRLKVAKNSIFKISSYHKDIASLSERMESCAIELQDILRELEHLDDGFQFSPERQSWVDSRLDTIYRLEKKHAVSSIQELLDVQEQLDQKLQHINSLGEEIEKVMELVDKSYARLQQLADVQTQIRRKGAQIIEKEILPLLAELGMPDAALSIKVTPLETFMESGHDKVQFLFNANKGGDLRELDKVLSGGEMSRFMLALKSIITQATLLPTIIFDEIDTGVSGDMAQKMGNIMKQMSQRMQIIAITHLPQIAGKCSQHLKVSKANVEEMTVSSIQQLSQEERVVEIAKMLSSNQPTESALRTAQELMK